MGKVCFGSAERVIACIGVISKKAGHIANIGITRRNLKTTNRTPNNGQKPTSGSIILAEIEQRTIWVITTETQMKRLALS